jgi:hypothetical protein
MHNFNVLFALTETCVLSGLPVRFRDASLAPLWGCAYVLFTWFMMRRWTGHPQKHGPQFIYFFFDTTIPGLYPTIVLIVLLLVLLCFYGLFCCTEVLLARIGGGIGTNIVFVAVVSSTVMRFRD